MPCFYWLIWQSKKKLGKRKCWSFSEVGPWVELQTFNYNLTWTLLYSIQFKSSSEGSTSLIQIPTYLWYLNYHFHRGQYRGPPIVFLIWRWWWTAFSSLCQKGKKENNRGTMHMTYKTGIWILATRFSKPLLH